MTWGLVAVAGATLGAGYLQSKSASKAGDSQQQAAQQQLALQQQMWQQQLTNEQPFMNFGQGAGGLGGLAALMGGNYDGFMKSPDYQVGLDAYENQLANKQAAHYNLFSGGAALDRDRAAQDYALSKLGDYRNSLMWGANLGQNAATGVGQASQNYANQAGNAYGTMGQAASDTAIAQGNSWANTIGSLGNLAGQYFGKPVSTSAYSEPQNWSGNPYKP